MFLADIFTRVIMPVFIVIALGYVFARVNHIDTRPFTTVVWNVTGPCLGFASLATTTIPDDDFARLFFFVVLITLAMWPITSLAAGWLGLDRPTKSSFELSVLFGNCVNYGFPVLLFAWGQAAVDRGVIVMTGNQVMLATAAVFIASRGRTSWKTSLGNILRVPLLYAAILGFTVNRLGIVIPKPIFDPIQLVGNANIMLMLLMLGMQLAEVKFGEGRKAIGVAVVLRLVVGVAIGVLVAALLGMQGLTRQTAIIEAGVPTAVYASVIASQYDVEPGFAAATILATTLLSMASLTLVLAWLGVR